MALNPPGYIPRGFITGAPVEHDWSDWNPYSVMADANDATEAALRGVTNRAQLAFSIACAEWVVFRFLPLLDDVRPVQFLEACWAFQMSDEFAAPPESEPAEWTGPVRGPVDLSLMTILNTNIACEDGSGHLDAAFAEAIVLHVVPDTASYYSWREFVLERLRANYPRTQQESGEMPVPREALDPTVEFATALSPGLIDRFLAGLDRSNPFVASADRISNDDESGE